MLLHLKRKMRPMLLPSPLLIVISLTGLAVILCWKNCPAPRKKGSVLLLKLMAVNAPWEMSLYVAVMGSRSTVGNGRPERSETENTNICLEAL